MNKIQQDVFRYLSSGEGSTSYRETALQKFTTDGFFTAKTEAEAADFVREFCDDENETGNRNFCREGVEKFRIAILDETGAPAGPRTDSWTVVVNLDLQHEFGDPDDSDTAYEQVADLLTQKVGAAVNLLRGEGWSVSNGRVDDTYSN